MCTWTTHNVHGEVYYTLGLPWTVHSVHWNICYTLYYTLNCTLEYTLECEENEYQHDAFWYIIDTHALNIYVQNAKL